MVKRMIFCMVLGVSSFILEPVATQAPKLLLKPPNRTCS